MIMAGENDHSSGPSSFILSFHEWNCTHQGPLMRACFLGHCGDQSLCPNPLPRTKIRPKPLLFQLKSSLGAIFEITKSLTYIGNNKSHITMPRKSWKQTAQHYYYAKFYAQQPNGLDQAFNLFTFLICDILNFEAFGNEYLCLLFW